MKKKTLLLTLMLILTFTLVACNLPNADVEEGPSLEDQAGTLAAQTLTAAAEQMPTETQVPANTPTKPRPTVTPAPSLTPTATSQLSAPKKPTLDTYNFTCAWNGANLDLNVTVQWVDNAVNEQGYYIYRNNEQIADLDPNRTSYVDQYAVDGGVTVSYAVEAYNSLGRSQQINFTVKCD